MSDKEKNLNPEDESFEDIFSSLREKYNLQPFGSEEKTETPEEKPVFYNPTEDSEIDDFFKEAEDYLYGELALSLGIERDEVKDFIVSHVGEHLQAS